MTNDIYVIVELIPCFSMHDDYDGDFYNCLCSAYGYFTSEKYVQKKVRQLNIKNKGFNKFDYVHLAWSKLERIQWKGMEW